jgi:hypothetical protein
MCILTLNHSEIHEQSAGVECRNNFHVSLSANLLKACKDGRNAASFSRASFSCIQRHFGTLLYSTLGADNNNNYQAHSHLMRHFAHFSPLATITCELFNAKAIKF